MNATFAAAQHLVRVNREYTDTAAKTRVAAQFVAKAGLCDGLSYGQILRVADAAMRAKAMGR